MKFNLNKYKGFTVGELMIMLAVLTVLLAAFAPVFTVRYNNASAEDVWAFVQDSEEYDAYSDQISKAMTSQFFFGISPASNTAVITASKAASNALRPLFSKLVIRPTETLRGSEKLQKQIQFRYGNSTTGKNVGALFAGNNNILFGGDYVDIKAGAQNNTSFGRGTLNKITTGKGNTALGYNTLKKLTSATGVTAIGYQTGVDITNSNSYNTLVGDDLRIAGEYNTVLGHGIGAVKSIGDSNTIVSGLVTHSPIGTGNVGVGYYALGQPSKSYGNYNTIVGGQFPGAQADDYGSNNTGIGYNACVGVSGSNKTCIGAESGVSTSTTNVDLLSDNVERIFIGQKPVQSDLGGVAVLEVHNIDSTNSGSVPVGGVGDSSVVINGNLMIRGATYLTSPQMGAEKGPTRGQAPYLIGMVDSRAKTNTHEHLLTGVDGRYFDLTTDESCGGRCKRHVEEEGRPSCICTRGNVISYDWTSKAINPYGCMDTGNAVSNGQSYKDLSTDVEIHHIDRNDVDYAHTLTGASCCPLLTSDIRLKNLNGVFTGGLDEIKKLKVYNFTYKSDKDKIPHVGVIAQDLKRVFPTAVSKDENGYYQIRWDEMLYAAINAVKTLYTKVEDIAAKIAKDQKRIAVLKKDNAQLEKRLDSLASELTVLENQRKK